MERKAALIGSQTGPWIRTSGMRNLHLNARVQRDVIVKVEQTDQESDEPKILIFTGAGVKRIEDRCWTRVHIVDGPFIDALCLLQTAKAS